MGRRRGASESDCWPQGARKKSDGRSLRHALPSSGGCPESAYANLGFSSRCVNRARDSLNPVPARAWLKCWAPGGRRSRGNRVRLAEKKRRRWLPFQSSVRLRVDTRPDATNGAVALLHAASPPRSGRVGSIPFRLTDRSWEPTERGAVFPIEEPLMFVTTRHLSDRRRVPNSRPATRRPTRVRRQSFTTARLRRRVAAPGCWRRLTRLVRLLTLVRLISLHRTHAFAVARGGRVHAGAPLPPGSFGSGFRAPVNRVAHVQFLVRRPIVCASSLASA